MQPSVSHFMFHWFLSDLFCSTRHTFLNIDSDKWNLHTLYNLIDSATLLTKSSTAKLQLHHQTTVRDFSSQVAPRLRAGTWLFAAVIFSFSFCSYAFQVIMEDYLSTMLTPSVWDILWHSCCSSANPCFILILHSLIFAPAWILGFCYFGFVLFMAFARLPDFSACLLQELDLSAGVYLNKLVNCTCILPPTPNNKDIL